MHDKENEKDKQVLIYGAGNLGRQVFDKLKKFDINVTAFLDRKADNEKKFCGIDVYAPDTNKITQYEKQEYIVLLAVILPSDELRIIKEKLVKLGYKNIIVKYSLINPWQLFTSSTQYCIEQETKIKRAKSLLSDEESRQVFNGSLNAFQNNTFETALTGQSETQYFGTNIPFAKGFENFVDCGAYIGDSLESGMKSVNIKNYYAFEPDEKNYERLLKTVQLYSDKLNNAVLFPCGVADKMGYSTFSGGADSRSLIIDGGESTIQTVKLDDVLKKLPISMLKMDIEGAELEALAGAVHIIKEQKPDLCICVYHHVSDLWEIPLFLHEIVPSYKFFLRAHEKWTIETVLYATTDKV